MKKRSYPSWVATVGPNDPFRLQASVRVQSIHATSLDAPASSNELSAGVHSKRGAETSSSEADSIVVSVRPKERSNSDEAFVIATLPCRRTEGLDEDMVAEGGGGEASSTPELMKERDCKLNVKLSRGSVVTATREVSMHGVYVTRERQRKRRRTASVYQPSGSIQNDTLSSQTGGGPSSSSTAEVSKRDELLRIFGVSSDLMVHAEASEAEPQSSLVKGPAAAARHSSCSSTEKDASSAAATAPTVLGDETARGTESVEGAAPALITAHDVPVEREKSDEEVTHARKQDGASTKLKMRKTKPQIPQDEEEFVNTLWNVIEAKGRVPLRILGQLPRHRDFRGSLGSLLLRHKRFFVFNQNTRTVEINLRKWRAKWPFHPPRAWLKKSDLKKARKGGKGKGKGKEPARASDPAERRKQLVARAKALFGH